MLEMQKINMTSNMVRMNETVQRNNVNNKPNKKYLDRKVLRIKNKEKEKKTGTRNIEGNGILQTQGILVVGSEGAAGGGLEGILVQLGPMFEGYTIDETGHEYS